MVIHSSAYRRGMTMIEVLTAVALATFVVSIGFTGIQGFSKAITRAKQFTAETQLISAFMAIAARQGDGSCLLKNGSPDAVSAWITRPDPPGNRWTTYNSVPPGWPTISYDYANSMSGSSTSTVDPNIYVKLNLKVGISNAQVGGNIKSGLQADASGLNYVVVKAIMIYR